MPRAPLERWCQACFGFVSPLPNHLCPHCHGHTSMPRTQLLSNRLRLTWHEVVARKGPGRKQRIVGTQTFSTGTEADLWAQAQELLRQGFLVTIAPASPTTVDAEACEVSDVIDVAVLA
jgi:hypothetical protein